jgi:CBS domain-containing protein
MSLTSELTHFLASVHPYDSLTGEALEALAAHCAAQDYLTGAPVFSVGDEVAGLYVITSGEIEVSDETGVQLSLLGPRNSFGERALLRGTCAERTACAREATRLIHIPKNIFHELIEAHAPVRRFFDRRRPERAQANPFATLSVARLMTRDPLSCAPQESIRAAAARMAERGISSICVMDGDTFQGIVTLRDLNRHVVVGGMSAEAPLSAIMTPAPLALDPHALVTDVLHLMMEQRIGHVPIVEADKLVGIVTQTDLTRAQALSSADIVRRVAHADEASEMVRATAEIPQLLVQLIDNGNRHEVVTRIITDIADAATRRLLTLAQAQLGPAPARYLWLACGSQGRQEQTGVSDQDNCLILADDASDDDMAYFEELARYVSDGLDAIGYFYCPGDMMASAARWRQKLSTWKDYFNNWIATPNPEAQMLASVMFDLRPIGGDQTLFEGLQSEVLETASQNSIFVAHMVGNSLKHHPPLGLLRGLATIRSGEHRNELDLKHNGVVPVVDLGRIYALNAQLRQANTRARLEAAISAGALSQAGGADLLDAYDLIAQTRLEHQAAQIRAGKQPSNYLAPSELSDFERSHLRDAFVVVKTMQSAAGSGKGALG